MLGPDPGDLVPVAASFEAPDESTVQEWYLKLASCILAHPGASPQEMAALMNKSIRWISTIRNSDAFKEYFLARAHRADSVIKEKTAVATDLALSRIIERLETIGDVIPLSDLADLADKGAKRLGFGPAPVSPSVNLNVGVSVGRGDLENARKRMTEVYGVQVERPAVSVPLVGSSALGSVPTSEARKNAQEAEVLK